MHLHVSPSELLIGMLVVLAAVALLAEKIKIAYPILLVLAGCAMGIVPAFHPTLRIQVNPETVFFVFLPPLLYYGALLTTWRDFKANINQISSLAVGLVLATMVVVAVIAMAVIPGMSWPAAFLLGAIVSPPDAVAATAVLSKLKVPKRVVTILEGESLVNDATALVAYKTALGAIVAGSFSLAQASGGIFVAAVGGIAIGLIAAWLIAKLMSIVEVPAVESVLALLVPFAAFIPADKLGASGVLAAVAAGVYMGRKLPSLGSPQQRIRTLAVWDSLVFLLNGIIFILIGLELYFVVQSGQRAMSLHSLLLGAACVAAGCILVRIFWVFPAVYLPRLIPTVRKTPVPPWQEVTIVSWAGMRGIVTLAAALAIPIEVPQRDVILFISFFVILATLVGQGLTFAPLIKILRLQLNDDLEHREEIQARLDAAHAAVSRLTVISFDESINPDLINRVRAQYDERITRLGGTPQEELGVANTSPDEALRTIQLEALRAERRMITFMRDQNILGDEVLRKILHEFDLEEAKIRTSESSALPRS